MTFLAIALLTPATMQSVAAASGDIGAAEAKVTAAQRQADTAAAAFDAAQGKYYQLDLDKQHTRAEIGTLLAERHSLAAVVQARAVTLYEQGPLQVNVIGDGGDILATARRSVLVAAANANSDQAIARLGALGEDLRARESTLSTQLESQRRTLDQLRAQQVQVQRTLLDAEQAVQNLRTQLAREQRAREFSAILERARTKAAASSGTRDNSVGSAGEIIASGDWVCPVQGAVSFTDTFGAPRGGGHTHHGVDMFAARGTPLVAVTGGSLFFQSDSLGGLAAYVTGSDGTTYYYAHLNDYVGGNRTVSAGEVIGHVGNTGDASGGPSHLHFEIRPGGPNGIAIDPTPTVRAHC